MVNFLWYGHLYPHSEIVNLFFTCPSRFPHLPYTLSQVLDCMKEKACETSIDVYNHNSPAYQVSRGDCICYTGDIVCQRPREGE